VPLKGGSAALEPGSCGCRGRANVDYSAEEPRLPEAVEVAQARAALEMAPARTATRVTEAAAELLADRPATEGEGQVA
jgi:hypothetical protein